MTPPTPPPIDLVTVAIAVATALFGAPVASVVGPYSVILLGAVLGGAWSLSRRDQTSRMSGFSHLTLAVIGALLLTVPAAEVLARHTPIEARWALGPVAAIVAGIGQDWPAVGRWVVGLVRRRAERVMGDQGDRR